MGSTGKKEPERIAITQLFVVRYPIVKDEVRVVQQERALRIATLVRRPRVHDDTHCAAIRAFQDEYGRSFEPLERRVVVIERDGQPAYSATGQDRAVSQGSEGNSMCSATSIGTPNSRSRRRAG